MFSETYSVYLSKEEALPIAETCIVPDNGIEGVAYDVHYGDGITMSLSKFCPTKEVLDNYVVFNMSISGMTLIELLVYRNSRLRGSQFSLKNL